MRTPVKTQYTIYSIPASCFNSCKISLSICREIFFFSSTLEQKLGVNQDRMIPMVWLCLLEGGGGYMSTISVDIASDEPGAQSASAARGGGAGGILDTRTPVNTDRDRADTGPGHGLYCLRQEIRLDIAFHNLPCFLFG